MDGRLKQVRKAKGYTQADMAALLGYSSKSGYAMIENGRNVPKLHTAIRIARILDMEIETLFGITPPRSMLDNSNEPMQQLESTQNTGLQEGARAGTGGSNSAKDGGRN